MMAGHTPICWLLLAALSWGCSTGSAGSAPPPEPSLARPSASATGTPATPEGTVRPTVAPTVAEVRFRVGEIAVVTATDGLQMRSMPSMGSGSERYTPLLPKGTDLYVISGPTAGSGYQWYEVSPISFHVTGLVEAPQSLVGPGSRGWVAVASDGGEGWLQHGVAACPAAPRDVQSLAGLTVGASLGCFGGVPITLPAEILPCNCDIDGPAAIEPEMFARHGWWGVTSAELEAYGGGVPQLVSVGTTAPLQKWPIDLPMLFLYLDPKGSFPAKAPVGQSVTVTGMFDHPAAAQCQVSLMAPDPLAPSDTCRYLFVLTSIK